MANKMDEIKQKMHDANERWIAARREMHELRKQEIEEKKKELRKYVGRCFKTEDENTYAIIIDVPHEYHTKTSTEFNEYQLPAMFLHFTPDGPDTGNLPWIDHDTFFYGDLPEVEHPLKSMQKKAWSDISSEAFWNAYGHFNCIVRNLVQGRVASAAASEFAKLAQSGLPKEIPNGGWFKTNKKLAEEMSDE